MVHPGAESKEKKSAGHAGKQDRHSNDAKTSAYGTGDKRQGGGKYNWGGDPEGDSSAAPLDCDDPMYDEGEEVNGKTNGEERKKDSKGTDGDKEGSKK